MQRVMYLVKDNSNINIHDLSANELKVAEREGKISKIKNIKSFRGKTVCYCPDCASELHKPSSASSCSIKYSIKGCWKELSVRYTGKNKTMETYLTFSAMPILGKQLYPLVSVALDVLNNKNKIERLKSFFETASIPGLDTDLPKDIMDVAAVTVAESILIKAIKIDIESRAEVASNIILGDLSDDDFHEMHSSEEYWVLTMLCLNHVVNLYDQILFAGYKSIVKDVILNKVMVICIPDREIKAIYFVGTKNNLLNLNPTEINKVIADKVNSAEFRNKLFSLVNEEFSKNIQEMLRRDIFQRDEISGCVDKITYNNKIHINHLMSRIVATCVNEIHITAMLSKPDNPNVIVDDLVEDIFGNVKGLCVSIVWKDIQDKKFDIGQRFYDHLLKTKMLSISPKKDIDIEKQATSKAKAEFLDLTTEDAEAEIKSQILRNNNFSASFNRLFNPKLFSDEDLNKTWSDAVTFFEKLVARYPIKSLKSILGESIVKQAFIIVNGNLSMYDKSISLSQDSGEKLWELYQAMSENVKSKPYNDIVKRLYQNRQQYEPDISKENIFSYIWYKCSSGSDKTFSTS